MAHNPSVIYEVAVTIDATIFDKYCEFLKDHIPRVLKVPGFLGAEVFEEEGTPYRIVVHYRVKDRESLEIYFKTQAPELRNEAIQLFPSGFTATRRVLMPRGMDFNLNTPMC